MNDNASIFLKKYHLTQEDLRDYPMPEEKDFKILALVKTLEKKKLSADDRATVSLIRSQLEDDWRDPLLKKLEELTEKYS